MKPASQADQEKLEESSLFKTLSSNGQWGGEVQFGEMWMVGGGLPYGRVLLAVRGEEGDRQASHGLDLFLVVDSAG